jgi:TldD protein
MSSLRDHEVEIASLLRKVERHTPFCEVMAERSEGEAVQLDTKSLSTSPWPRVAGLAVRAWAKNRWVEGASSAFDERSLSRLGEELVRQLDHSAQGPAPPGESSSAVGSHEDHPAHPLRDLGTEHMVARARELLGWGMAVPGIKVAQVGIRWVNDERWYLNTSGADCFQRTDRVQTGLVPIAVENGRSRLNFQQVGGLGGVEIVDEFTEEMVRGVAEGARDLLGAKEPPVGPTNVILDPGVAGTFAHESFGHGAEADQFVRNRSYLRPLLGQRLGPESLTIVDDGSLPGQWGTIYFDDEGHPGQRTVMVDHGRFVGALHDRNSAAALGTKPTGNTRRADFLSRAYVRMTNTIVEPGSMSFEELVEEAGDGVVLERWQSGMEDPAGGQMQLKVLMGHRIEGGKVTDLVGAMALSGTVLGFLRDIRGVGKSTGRRLDPGYCGKGHGDYIPVGGGGAYLLSRALVGPA